MLFTLLGSFLLVVYLQFLVNLMKKYKWPLVNDIIFEPEYFAITLIESFNYFSHVNSGQQTCLFFNLFFFCVHMLSTT